MAPFPPQRAAARLMGIHFVAVVLLLAIGPTTVCSTGRLQRRILLQDCTPDSEMGTRCTNISRAQVSPAAGPVARVSTEMTLRLLVMVVSYTASSSCGARASADVADVRAAYTNELGYMNFLRNCSYGQVTYSNVTVISTPVPCTQSLELCNTINIAVAAKESAESQYGSGFTSSYSRYAYVLPYGLNLICGWMGLGEPPPGTQTWYIPEEDGIFNKGTVLQESLHNLGLRYHGWRSNQEYQDNSTSMGMGKSCPSAPELWRLGWASPLAQLNSSTLPPKTFKTYTLPATYATSQGNMLRIQPDWLSKRNCTKNLYLALRMRGGGDRDLLGEFDGKVSYSASSNIQERQFKRPLDAKNVKRQLICESHLGLPKQKLLLYRRHAYLMDQIPHILATMRQS
ncbi:hypothetical protein Vretimale_2152 [Volvox reticuliferus]|uniref:Uncharacterized protein n=1 Tax=Volvox reticuliferus TaxID=1737510 RepID=A0A8J4C350_9CHLO|nr:hypothetical protein Vretifemale_4480 [Volvox reticuliferus]GIL96423.1 hypothetical protein Vretimale_2152 [Volvox reticuliferus]